MTEREEQELRVLLWLNHGHTGLYGDDGEMQCSECMPVWDYKRIGLPVLLKRVLKMMRYRTADLENKVVELEHKLKEAEKNLKLSMGLSKDSEAYCEYYRCLKRRKENGGFTTTRSRIVQTG